jgi:signal transduction histidine kinase
VAGEVVRVDADATRLEQVVSNLLDNALKYTPSGGRIEITTAAEGSDAVLRVRDAGVGIDADTLPRIFDLFVQADQTSDRSAGGCTAVRFQRRAQVRIAAVSSSCEYPGRPMRR